VRADGQKVPLAIKSMGGDSAEAWRTVLDDLIKRGLRRPEFLIVDGAPGLDTAIAAVVDGWQTLATSLSISQLTLLPETIPSCYRRSRYAEFQPHSGRHPWRRRPWR
jgi:transposase-like protein